MSETIYQPINDVVGLDIREVAKPGLVLPLKARDPALLMTKWDDAIYAVLAGGAHAFSHFKVKSDNPFAGLFIPEPEILIDYTSVTDGSGLRDERGLLFLQGNKPCVVSVTAGNGWQDGVLVPLWSEIGEGSDNVHVCFKRWALGVRTAQGHQVLWRFDHDKKAEKG